jgi:hypothetical protein
MNEVIDAMPMNELLLHDTDRHLRSEDVPLAAPQILGNVYGLNGPSVLP